MKSKLSIISLIVLIVGTFNFGIPHAFAEVSTVRSITFPVLGGAPYQDDFGDPRSGGRTHEGIDIMGKKMQPLVAAVKGTVSFITSTEASWGYSLAIRDADGYEYDYLHINNDTPGTDDGNGGYNNAFAPGIKLGSKVLAGQTIAFLGDSGNAETTGAHLHFEIRVGSTNEAINPYQSLVNSTVIYSPVVNTNMETDTTKPTPTRPSPTPTRISTNLASEIFPYEEFDGGANIASGNLDADSDLELVTGTAFNGGGRTIINVYDLDGTKTKTFFAYGDVFRGGVDVAVGDVDGDGKNEIITAAGPGGGPHIKVFKPDGTLVSEFMAYGAGFRGGVHVSSADINGDGKAEIVTGPGAGGGPHVRVFNKDGVIQAELFAYGAIFTGGVDVAAFPSEGTVSGGFATAPGTGGGPHVKVFNATGKLTSEFMANDATNYSGLRISAGNYIKSNEQMEIAVMPAANSAPNIKIFKTDGSLLKSGVAGFEPTAAGGYDVTIAGQIVYVSTQGGRKTSIRKVSGL